MHRIDDFVRYETAVTKSPQQVVEYLKALMISNMNVYAVIEPIGFLSQPTGKLLP